MSLALEHHVKLILKTQKKVIGKSKKKNKLNRFYKLILT